VRIYIFRCIMMLTTNRMPSFSLLVSSSPKILSEDVQLESQKVRSMYESGTTCDWQDGKTELDSLPKIDKIIGEEISEG